MVVEIIGIIASIIIAISMCCKAKTTRSLKTMRILNNAGSVLFIIYGLMIPAYSTAIMNAVIIIINTYNLMTLE